MSSPGIRQWQPAPVRQVELKPRCESCPLLYVPLPCSAEQLGQLAGVEMDDVLEPPEPLGLRAASGDLDMEVGHAPPPPTACLTPA